MFQSNHKNSLENGAENYILEVNECISLFKKKIMNIIKQRRLLQIVPT